MKSVNSLFSMTALALAVSCTGATASDDTPSEKKAFASKPAYTMVDFRSDMKRTANDFFNGGRTWLKFRTMYHNKQIKNSTSDTKQLGLGIEANFQSGWLNDTVGLDLSAYTGQRLDGFGIEQQGTGSGMFIREGSRGIYNYKGYGKIGQAFVKVKWENPGIDGSGNLRIGRQLLYKGLMGSSNSRLTPLTWNAAVADYNVYGTEIYGAYANGISQKNSSNFEAFSGSYGGNSKIKYIYTYGIKRQPVKGLGFEAALGEGQGYLRQWMGRLNYTFDINRGIEVYADAQYYQSKTLDEENIPNGRYKKTTHKDWDFNNRPFDLDAKAELINLNFMLSKGDLSGWVSWQHTKAPLTNNSKNRSGKNFLYGNGQYSNSLASNGYSANNAWIGIPNYVGMFTYDGMRSYQLGARYHWDKLGFPGWYTSLVHTYGSGANRLVKENGVLKPFDGHEQENMLEIKYRFQSHTLKRT